MSYKRNIIVFGPSDWWTMNPSSGTHIAEKFAVNNKVLYINPISTDLGGTVQSGGISSNFFKKAFRKLKSYLKMIRKVKKGLYVCSPFFIPIQGRPVIDAFNNVMVSVQLNIFMFFLGMRKKSLWLENMRASDFIKRFNWELVIYQVSDLYVEDRYTKNKDKLIERDNLATEKSDIIVCVSNELREWKLAKKSNVHYIPHGVDYESFEAALKNKALNPRYNSNGKPVVGYFGTLTNSNDIEMLEYCAEQLRDFYFVFAGRITQGDYSKLKKKDNVVFLGHLPYDEIPTLCASFEVGLLAWKMTKWIEHCNPLKLFEYMACGLKIVSVGIREIKKNYSDVVSIAQTKEEFCKAIKWELENDTEERKQKRIDLAVKNSWTNHMLHIEQLMDEAMKQKGKR